MEPNAESLRRCPVCRYQLDGLPANYKCPECGFEFDDTMRVWWVPVIPGWIVLFAWVVAFAALELRFSGFLRSGLGFSRTESAALLTVASGLVPFASLFFPRGFVAAGRNGLTYRFPWRRARTFGWNEIHVGKRLRVICRVRKGLRIPLRLPGVGLPRKRRRVIHNEILRRWQERAGVTAEKLE